ncbi:1-aminocyclopropane-1-carboxylate oxidase homolog 1 [Cajanus cajan]|uniref:1-aminocyclopropane-1-carboxylate oxidase isogeny 1 n=1 Tax=Cajanus cajan TaxID=3821 RepID=A0A151S8W3_CAJCA|nr:1-aminocyclopropane-1-carboxylate oxidase homolog 1 [Cajanus cajan]KYP51181.1 1-aminocyclopropane-1-carboxylate oxidase isogeny 1 [Cajanus cajan]
MGFDSGYDRAKEVKEFEESKGGVKGLVDSGILKLPRFLIHPPETLPSSSSSSTRLHLHVPVIDFTGHDVDDRRRSEIVGEIREASEKWGFFQMVNHGVPVSVMEEMVRVIREFHEQEREVKREWYSRDEKMRVRFFCNGDLLVGKVANCWRDTLMFDYQHGSLSPQDYPPLCREAVIGYMEHIFKLKETLSQLLSEALGLNRDYLTKIECMKGETVVCHYYPPCPEPELTLGTTKHSDPSCLTILLQDNIGGLQVLHQNQWVDINPIPGALVANIGDFMQLISNDKFKSVEHRVLVGRVGPRVSAACHIYPNKTHKYGPIEEFISNENPPKYRETHIGEYLAHYRLKGLDGSKALLYFTL